VLEVELGVEPKVNLTQQRNRKRYKGNPRVHLSFILDYIAFLYWDLEHIVLIVLRIQTLENKSLVKDLTHLVPSLVLGMKYSTHTIIKHSQVPSSFQESSRSYS
jgi:hypothetical protein